MLRRFSFLAREVRTSSLRGHAAERPRGRMERHHGDARSQDRPVAARRGRVDYSKRFKCVLFYGDCDKARIFMCTQNGIVWSRIGANIAAPATPDLEGILCRSASNAAP